MKYLLIFLLLLVSNCSINEPKKLTYEVFSNHPHFTVTYLTYSGEQRTEEINLREWRITFPVDPGSPAYLKVVGDTVQAMQARIRFDSRLLIEETKEDTLPIIEFSIVLY